LVKIGHWVIIQTILWIIRYLFYVYFLFYYFEGLRGVTDPTTWNGSFGVKPAVNIEFRLNKNIKAETNDQLRDQNLSVRPTCLKKKSGQREPRAGFQKRRVCVKWLCVTENPVVQGELTG